MTVLLSAGWLVAAVGPAASAQEAMALLVETDATLRSDYRFRGFSYTELAPTLKLETQIEYAGVGGLHVGAIASATTRLDEDAFGETTLEIDYLVGYTKLFEDFWVDATAVYYTWPGSELDSGYEIYGSGGFSLGDADFELGGAYAPAQPFNELPFEQERLDNLYLWAKGRTTLVPDYMWTGAKLGYETGAYLDFYAYDSLEAVTAKLDWELGVQACDEGFRYYSLSYVGTSQPGPFSSAAAVASIWYGF